MLGSMMSSIGQTLKFKIQGVKGTPEELV